MEDVRDWVLSKSLGRVQTLTLAAATARVILPPNPRRIAFQFSNGATAYALDNSAPTAQTNGLLSTTFNPPWGLDVWTHGGIVQQPWYGFSTAGGAIWFWESTYLGDEDIMQLMLQSMKGTWKPK